MIFAKDDNHATEIVDIAKNVFKPEFENDAIPEKFVQKITYSVGDSNALIRDLRTEKDFRIAVTVTLVATGTDVKPLEVLQNIGVPATRLQNQTVCTPCLNLMITDISNLSKGVKTQ